jgi:hypothetical protein
MFSIFVGSGFIVGIVFAAAHALFFLFSSFIGYSFFQKGANKPWFALPGTALQYSPSAAGDVPPLHAPDPSLPGPIAGTVHAIAQTLKLCPQ